MRGAVVLQGEEKLEAICAAAALRSEVCEIVNVDCVCAWGVVEEVACGEGECAVEGVHVAAEEKAGGDGGTEHLVRVDGDAVCEVGACKARGCVGWVEDYAAAPGAVDVEPEVVCFADCRERGEGVKGSLDGRAGCGVEEQGCFAPSLGLVDAAFELSGDHAAAVVDRDGDDVSGAQAKEVCGFLDRVVAVGRGEEGELVASIAIGLCLWVQCVSGYGNGRGVGGTATWLGDSS